MIVLAPLNINDLGLFTPSLPHHRAVLSSPFHHCTLVGTSEAKCPDLGIWDSVFFHAFKIRPFFSGTNDRNPWIACVHFIADHSCDVATAWE